MYHIYSSYAVHSVYIGLILSPPPLWGRHNVVLSILLSVRWYIVRPLKNVIDNTKSDLRNRLGIVCHSHLLPYEKGAVDVVIVW